MKKRSSIQFLILFYLASPRIDAAETVIQEGPVKIASSEDRTIFPESWRSGRINAKAKLLKDREVDRSKGILNYAMKKYPKHVLAANIDSIYVLHSLEYSGIGASGTNSRDRIYIANRGSREGFTDCWLEGTFHEEFSSILLRNFPQYLNKDTWEAINDVAFKYGSSGVQAVRQGKARTRFDATLHPKGFLYEYAKSTLENDFNTIAEQSFLGDSRFWSVVSKYQRIRKKTDLVVEFYHKIDPSFNRSFFESLGNTCNAEKGAAEDAGKPRRRT